MTMSKTSCLSVVVLGMAPSMLMHVQEGEPHYQGVLIKGLDSQRECITGGRNGVLWEAVGSITTRILAVEAVLI